MLKSPADYSVVCFFSSLGEALQPDYNSGANVVKTPYAASSLKPPTTRVSTVGNCRLLWSVNFKN
jgi:hypothetical protein